MINIYVGENGCGKSQMLGEIARNTFKNGQKVIAIATAANDKFPKRNYIYDYHYMGSRLGKFIATKAIKESFTTRHEKQDRFIEVLFSILEYVGYDQRLGLHFKNIAAEPAEKFENFLYSLLDTDSSTSSLFTTINWDKDLNYLRNHLNDNWDNTIWLNAHDSSRMLDGQVLVSILENEKIYKKAKIFSSLEILIQKNGYVLPLNSASSGEISLISTAVFIASKLSNSQEHATVLIDEPENSLHPEWQKNYVMNLLNLFPYYDIEFHIATHSPMIIAGASQENNIQLLRYDGEDFKRILSPTQSIEDALIDQFGIVTPQNNALSQRCIVLINKVDLGEIDKHEAHKELSTYKSSAYDLKQIQFLDGISNIIDNIEVHNGKA